MINNSLCELEIWGDFACFTRPEMKVERVSYDVITPSSARGVFDAILWKPQMFWQIKKIEVLEPIRWTMIKRNEVTEKASHRNTHLITEKVRSQRTATILKNVRYRISAEVKLTSKAEEGDSIKKYSEMFLRRVEKGQSFNMPYLGCREFSCFFSKPSDRSPIEESRDSGWMLYDIEQIDYESYRPMFFRASLLNGSIEVPDIDSSEVLR